MLSAKEFELLLPWYLNGTLSDSQRGLVTTYLEAHPEEAARVQWNASLRSAIKSQADELPVDLGLKRVLASVAGIEERAEEAPYVLEKGPVTAAGSQGQITHLLQRQQAGDVGARASLFAVAYGELKRLAHVRLAQSSRSELLDTTALVHEAYLRMTQSAELRAEDRRSFFAFASQVMRNVVVDAARTRLAQRRGGGEATGLTLSTQLPNQLSSGEEAILDVDEVLRVLEQAEPRLAQLVEMRYYGGYTEAEIAETLGVTERAVQRDWKKARLLLKAALDRKR